MFAHVFKKRLKLDGKKNLAVFTGAMLSSRPVGNVSVRSYIHVPLLLLKSIKIQPHLYISLKKKVIIVVSDVSKTVNLNLIPEFLTDFVFDISL